MIPSFKSKSFMEIRFHKQNSEFMEKFIQIHPFSHCLKVVTDFPNPPPPPAFPHQLYHVRIRSNFFQNKDVLSDIFSGECIFCSLSSLSTGNGLFVQRSNITFFLNESTYQRLGLTGKKHDNFHIVLINESNQKQLERAQIGEPIEGVLFTKHIEYYEDYLEKVNALENSIKGWNFIHEPSFDLEKLSDFTTLHKTWSEEFLKCIDDINMQEDEIMAKSGYQSITIEGFFNLEFYKEWLLNLGQEHNCIIQVWDMKDIPGSFLGNKLRLTGFGGGHEIVFHNSKFANILEIKTIEYMNEE